MIFYVLQEKLPLESQALYNTGDVVTVPKTVLIPQFEKFEVRLPNGSKTTTKIFPLRNKSRKKIFRESLGYSVFHFEEPVQKLPETSYNWGDQLAHIGEVDTQKLHFSLTNSPDNWGLVIPPEIVVNWGLREGDEVGVVVHRAKHLVLISSVNGEANPAITRIRPDLTLLKSEPSKRSLPVEMFGDFDLRVATLLAPIGLESFWVAGTGGSGKTWMEVKLAESCIKLATMASSPIPGLHLIVAYIGDRPGHASLFQNLVEKANHPHVEFFQSPWSDPEEFQASTGSFVINRARALVSQGINTALLLDSITRLVAADSATKAGDRLFKGGFDRSSVSDVVQQGLGTYGYFPDLDAHLGILGSALYSTGKDISADSSEGAIFKEVGPTATSGTLMLLNNPTLAYPRVSVDSTMSFHRFPFGHDWRTRDQIQEMEHVKSLMWAPLPEKRDADGKLIRQNFRDEHRLAEEAHRRLISYARINPRPKY